MKNLVVPLLFIILFSQPSCIDRDTIAGTGKQDPDRMVSAGGGFQSGTVNTKLPLPIIARVYDANNRPVRGVRVEFYAPNGNVSFSDTVVITDGDGNAKTAVTLGQKEDSIHIQAIVPGIKGSPVVFSFYAFNSGAQKILLKSGNNQVGTVGIQLSTALIIEVRDAYDNPVKNSLVYFIPSGKGKVSQAQILTDELGIAQSFWTMDTIIGNQSMEARITASQTSFVTFNAYAKPDNAPSVYQILSKDSTVGIQGTTLLNAIVVLVKDKYGNPLRSYLNTITGASEGGALIQFKIIKGGGTISSNALRTDENGIIQCPFIFDGFGSVTSIKGYTILDNFIPNLSFTMFSFVYISIDSASSSGGNVYMSWIKNTNPFFLNYKVERCANSNFDNSTVVVATVTNENTTSISDNTAVVGTSPYYRIQINYSNGYSFYSYNIKQITVLP